MALDIVIVSLLIPTVFATASFAQSATGQSSAIQNIGVYIGTNTQRGDSKGIYRSTLDMKSGQLTPPELAAEATNPNFIAIHPSRKFLYAVGSKPAPNPSQHGVVTAYAIDPATGNLRFLNYQSSGGAGPAYVNVDRIGANALVANYAGGSVGVLPIGSDGSLSPMSSFVQHEGSGPNVKRQDAPHAHSVYVDPANRFAFVCDLGADKIVVYRYDATRGTISPNDPPSVSVAPGAGPRHFAFHPDGKHAYVINELNSTVTAFNYDADRGALEMTQTVSTLPPGVDAAAVGNTTAEVVVHPSGKFLYGSNRGHNSIAIFAIDPSTAQLSPLGHQGSGIKVPRNFNIDPTGTWLLVANQEGDNVNVFRIDANSGMLAPTGQPIAVAKPVCIKFWTPEG
ncbi:MAG TPA: lactonase family protein [Pirellulales bacterium]|nr:lactonase family protein [Pirellulales bacterium]